jgi:hypothetical protein
MHAQKIVLVLYLSFALLGTSLTGLFPAGGEGVQVCSMTCCVGKPLHKKGECATDLAAKEAVSHESHTDHCSAKKRSKVGGSGVSLSKSSMSRPCRMDCSTGHSFSNPLTRLKQKLVKAGHVGLPPPANVLSSHFEYDLLQTRPFWSQYFSPRAPPHSFS